MKLDYYKVLSILESSLDEAEEKMHNKSKQQKYDRALEYATQACAISKIITCVQELEIYED